MEELLRMLPGNLDPSSGLRAFLVEVTWYLSCLQKGRGGSQVSIQGIPEGARNSCPGPGSREGMAELGTILVQSDPSWGEDRV